MFSLLLAVAAIITPLVMTQEKIIDVSVAPEYMVCAIEMKINEDLNRIPEQIKERRCAPEPTQWCMEKGFDGTQCCHHKVKGYAMGCVELTDHMNVFYKDKNESLWIDVAVGCACGILDVTIVP